eukprot:g4603.t1
MGWPTSSTGPIACRICCVGRGKKDKKYEPGKNLASLSSDFSDDTDLLEKGNENPMNTTSSSPSLSSSDFGDDDLDDGEEVFPLLDPSLIMSMERTVLSAYNQAFQIMMVGAGL